MPFLMQNPLNSVPRFTMKMCKPWGTPGRCLDAEGAVGVENLQPDEGPAAEPGPGTRTPRGLSLSKAAGIGFTKTKKKRNADRAGVNGNVCVCGCADLNCGKEIYRKDPGAILSRAFADINWAPLGTQMTVIAPRLFPLKSWRSALSFASVSRSKSTVFTVTKNK